MPTQTTINTASTTYTNKTFYEKKALETAKTQLVHANFGQKREIPRNSGKRVEFRRYDLFDVDAASLTLEEGVTPEAQNLSQTKVEAEVKQYGAYVITSDLLNMTAFDNVINDSAELLGEQLGRCIEYVTRDAMLAGASAQWAGGKTATDEITATDVMTINEIRKAVRTLKKNKARRFIEGGKPHFVCIADPDVAFDLQDDSKWENVNTHQKNAEAIYTGELGQLYGVVFVESTEGYVEEGAGAGGADIHHTMVFGADAYGTIDIDNSGSIRTIIKLAQDGGTEDPLEQRSTIACKVAAYAAAVLNPLWIIDVQSSAS